MRKLKDLSKDEVDQILAKRYNGTLEREILSFYNISKRQYSNLLDLNGISRNTKVDKYSFNENYFELIDTEDKAYFLGFIVADGGLHPTQNRLQISQKDPDVLYDFKKYIEFDGPVTKRKNRNVYEISMSSRKLISDFLNLGIYPGKTYTVEFPIIPIELENHFMRGVFDGDGCISIHRDSRDNSERGQVNMCSGSKDFIDVYVDKLVSYCGVKKNNIRNPKGTYYVIDWGGLSDVERIYRFLYKDANIYLNRKKKTFEKVISINNTKIKYRKS